MRTDNCSVPCATTPITPPRDTAGSTTITNSADLWLLGRNKIRPIHQERLAVVYVRQSSPHQVLEHRESRELQYKLRRRALEFGWTEDRVLVIDQDQAHSATVPDCRAGFQRVLAEVSLNHVGLILGIEMSRLARSNKDWHQLLEVCALFDTLLYDPDGLYDPANYNDRLLLGLKGTMSEAEIHILRARMEHGRLNKAERGELFGKIPCGYVQLTPGEVTIDPDDQVRTAITLIFKKFEDLGSANRLLRYLVRNEIRVPIRADCGSSRGDLEWRRPNRTKLLEILHHPIYAGAYAYGRRPIDRRRKKPGVARGVQRLVPRNQWAVFIPNRLPAYITWDQYLANQEKLTKNRTRGDGPGAPREGVSLLAGLIICGRCGYQMAVKYNGITPYYGCQGDLQAGGALGCQYVSGETIEQTVSDMVLKMLKPAALELSLKAADDIQRDRDLLHTQWRQRLERAAYDVEKASRHYNAIEPENRLVARELARRWEEALCQKRQLEEEYDRFLSQEPKRLSDDQRTTIMSLASDIPALWRCSSTSNMDRQTLVRYLIDRATVNAQGDSEYVDVAIHWKGGFVSQHEVIRSVQSYNQLRDFPRLKQLVMELYESGSTALQIAQKLNEEKFHSPQRKSSYNASMVRQIIYRYRLKTPSRGQRDDALLPNEWWIADLMRELTVSRHTLHGWRARAWLHARQVNGWWIVWADADELERLRRIRDHTPMGKIPYPSELTTPKPRRD